MQVDGRAGGVAEVAEQAREQLGGERAGVGAGARDHADGLGEALDVEPLEAVARQRRALVQRGESGAEAAQRLRQLGLVERLERAAVDGLDGERAVERRGADHARHVQAVALGGAGVLEPAPLALGDASGVDLGVREHASVLGGALGAGRALGRVGDQPRRHARAADQAVERARSPGEQRQRGEPAVVRERPEDGVELGDVDDGAQRRRGHGGRQRAVVGHRAGAGREAARGDVVVAAAGDDPVDDAQAVADAVLGELAPAFVDGLAVEQAAGQQLGDAPAVEQLVAVRDGRVGGEHHRGSSSVRNAASRPRATALTTGAACLTP